MSPVDAIRPPKKTKEITSSPKPKSLPDQKKEGKPLFLKGDEEHKQKLIWLLAIVITVFICIGWVWLFQSGQLTSPSSSQSDFFQQLGNKMGDLWSTIKTDILKIKDITENKNINTEEEKIKELEEKVFPQFDDPTKQ